VATDTYLEFRQCVDRPEESIDLGRAALTIALPEYPELDCLEYLRRIESLALEVSEGCGSNADAFRSIAALNLVLFSRHGFHGNRDAYYEADNSFLHRVIERKTGIPITLSVLYIEVAQRVGLSVSGVGFPGHFLVKTTIDDNEVVIDPFNGGEIKSPKDLDRMLRDMYGGNVGLRGEFLAPVSKKQILQRMLANLKGIYIKAEEWLKTLAVLDRMLILDPGSADDTRDRGVIYTRLDCFNQAKEDFERYLRLAPGAKDAAVIREQIADLAKRVVLVH
jgi:regulator of sirC expression with transglutaminase-like and TPR domain